MEISNSRLITKDAFWNSENVTVRDSFITSEYLGWNAWNLTLINCTIESLQGLCYIDNLVMRGCRLNHTNLAFEYSTVDAEIEGHIDSVFNPAGGRIKAGSIGEITAGSGAHRPRGHRHRDHGALSASRGARRPRLAVEHRYEAIWQGARPS